MIKLKDLYEVIDDTNIKYAKTGEDPVTGLNELVKHMIKINGRLKPTDPKLEELVLVMKNIRNRYKRYLNQYQPDWNN